MRRLDLYWCRACGVVTARPTGDPAPIKKHTICQACKKPDHLEPLLVFKTGPKDGGSPCQAYGVES